MKYGRGENMHRGMKIRNNQLIAYTDVALEIELEHLIKSAKPSNMSVYVVGRDTMVKLDAETLRVIVAVNDQEAYDYWMGTE
jgi:hypothetical protein